MDFNQLINERISTRKYLDKKVEREKIEACIEAARLAPSACNSQPWKFIVVDEEENLKEIRNSIYDPLIGINKFALGCQCFIVIVSEKRNITSKIGSIVKKKDYTSLDIGIASEHICLAATELGLGSCMIGWFKEKEIKNILGIPKNREIPLVIALGYYESRGVSKKVRKELDEIISYNKY